jgi:hypothetical protein
MEKVAGFPYAAVEFGKDGSALGSNDLAAIKSGLKDEGVTDLLVISHGWNNDKADARSLYERFFAALRSALQANPAYANRTYGILGIFWPSKKFAEEKLIPGGAAGISTGTPKANAKEVKAKVSDLKGVFSAPDAEDHLEAINGLLGKAENDQAAQREIIDRIRSIMRSAITDAAGSGQNEDNVDHFLTNAAGELIDKLGSPPRTDDPKRPTGTGGAADIPRSGARSAPTGNTGAAAGISFSGAWDAIKNALNYATYYEMKNRAGVVGRKGVYSTLRELQQDDRTRKLHLIGHSFGARVVTAASDGPGGGSPPLKPQSVSLVQAAFSHYAFADRWDGAHNGLFRDVLSSSKLAGPLLVTHSVNDKAVGIAYAIASRLANQVASAIGDANDKYGGLGRNGALKCGASNGVLGSPASYVWKPATVTNLKADTIIGGHSDIAKKQLGEAILSAVATT